MKLGIRFRFALWLLAVLLPVGAIALSVISRIDADVTDRVSADLEGVRELEAARIGNALDLYKEHARNLASGPHVRNLTAEVVRAREATRQDGAIAGYDGFDEIDAFADAPLQQLAVVLQNKTDATTAEVAALQIVGRSGKVFGETPGFDWSPADATLIERSMQTRATLIGDAYRDADGADRLGLVVPILAPNNDVVGALVLENDLGLIVDLVVAHEGFGQTSEAHIAQMNADGDAEFITLLRFERDAAFNKVVPAEKGSPINQSLVAPGGRLIQAQDYRGEASILAVRTLPDTGWGLVIKIDRAEALASVLSNTRALKGVVALGGLAVLIGWAVLLDPVARRLRLLEEGSHRVVRGDYETPLDDRRSDEIGSVAANIDRLATDLATDIAIRSDIEAELRHQATHDATTGLFNRQFATSYLEELSAAEGPNAAQFSVLFLDLDNFKGINDVYGHHTGDTVLEVIGQRLLGAVVDRGKVARWGGDEFVVVLPDTSEASAQDMVRRVERALTEPVQSDAGAHQVQASIGRSTYRPGVSVEQLLHSADEAMFEEKQRRSGSRSVSPESVRSVEQALEADQVEVWFQPVVVGSEDKILLQGAEALVRVRDRSGAILAPRSFLADVERSHVGVELDRRVLEIAVRRVAEWIDEGRVIPDFQLSVNGSEALMRDAQTPAFISGCLEAAGLRPCNLMLEIGERSAIVQPGVIAELDELGIKIAVDDLGLSNSNIDRLLDGGATVAKIDKRWLQIDDDAEGEGNAHKAVLQHLVSMCDALGFDVIAEGVETPDQLERIRELGVSRFQGYLFAEPMSGADFEGRFFATS